MKHLKSTLAFGKIAVLISIFCFLAAFSFAQSVQDLEAKLKTASAEEKPSILNQLAETYLMTDVNKAIEYAEQAYKASRKADDVNNEAGALITLGDAYKSFKNQKKAIQNYKDAIRIFDQFKQSNSSAY
ncbi:MAG TPA: tetratricopeptide repeat protein, partial [Bacteroidia bacterium]